MTELQKIFLLGVCVYYVFKGSLYVTLYVALIIVERHARLRHKKIKMMLRKKRADEQERWKVAYNLYEKQKDNPATKPLGLSELVTNPNSFTAYSNAKYCL
ncbi:hypothetical protein ASZ90_018228 [hydrocarbon metagenome]|uniref:Uncharacterized protein n=1 Tax=hydrocarbon metagenome TaxID=938273 RepID=A0A0W8E6U9_9ZZZZ